MLAPIKRWAGSSTAAARPRSYQVAASSRRPWNNAQLPLSMQTCGGGSRPDRATTSRALAARASASATSPAIQAAYPLTAHTTGADGTPIVGVGGSDPLGPGHDVGPQSQETVIEERADQTAGELRSVVAEQPLERGTQLRQRGIDLGDVAVDCRLHHPSLGGLDPLDVVASVTIAHDVGPSVRDELLGAERPKRLQQDVAPVGCPHHE